MKVNALVDEGIAPLVEALNQLDGVITLDSCQASPPANAGEAYVYFTYPGDWMNLARFLSDLSEHLRSLKLCCGYSVRLEWFGSNDQPRAQLVVHPEHVGDIASALLNAPGFRNDDCVK